MLETVDAIKINLGGGGLMVMNISLCFIMFGVALELTLEDFRHVFYNPKSTVVGVVSQFLVLPFLTFCLVYILKPRPSIALGMIMIAACPGGNISNFFSLLAKGNAALSVSLTAISTVLAIIMTPVNFTFWAGLYEPTSHILKEVQMNLWEVFKIVVIILGIPLILGMVVRHFRKNLALRLSPWIKAFGILFFAGFVVVAFFMNFDNFLKYIHLVVFVVFIHNAVALGTGYGLAFLARLPHEDRKSISIETGIQNSGLGLLLIFTFFDGLGGMALVVAWWSIWHIIAGFGVAWYWSVGKAQLSRIFSHA